MSGRTLYVRADNLGDVLLQGPAVRAVAEVSDELILWCGPNGSEAGRILPGVDRVVEAELPWISAGRPPAPPATLAGLVHVARRLDVDEAIISTSWHQSALPMALLLRQAGVEQIAAISEDSPGSLLDVRHRVPDDIHEVERAISLAAAAGAPIPGDKALRVRAETYDYSDDPYVVVHPGCTAPVRAWAEYNWRCLVEDLLTAGWRVVVTGAAAEADLCARVASRTEQVENLAGATTLAELAGLVEGASALVSANTGPMHLAAAVGTPVVCVYAPVVPESRWRPWMVEHRLLRAADSCPQCSSRGCEVPGHPCVDRVSPSSVARAVSELAGERISEPEVLTA